VNLHDNVDVRHKKCTTYMLAKVQIFQIHKHTWFNKESTCYSGATCPLKCQGFDKFYTGQTYKTKGKVFLVHVINAYARWPSVVNFIPVPL